MDASKYEVFGRCLRAAGGAPCLDNESIYLVYEEENELVEQLMKGPQLIDQDVIASPVKEGTAAAYVYLNENSRFAFCADENDTLKFYAYEDEWSEQSLGSMAGQKLLPGSKLQACPTPSGLQVYFQDPSGMIRYLAQNNGHWADRGVTTGRPRPGTPLSAAFAQAATDLYYVGEDEGLRRLRISHPDGRCEDDAVAGSCFEEPVENIIAFPGQSDKETNIFVLTANKVVWLDGTGNKTEVGYMEERNFQATKTDQFFNNNNFFGNCCVQ